MVLYGDPEKDIRVWVTPHENSPEPLPGERAITFPNRGYYWFLYPSVTDLIRRTGGQFRCDRPLAFSGSALGELRVLLDQVGSRIAAMPARWEVHVGHITAPLQGVNKDLIESVERESFLTLLHEVRQMAEAAAAAGQAVVLSSPVDRVHYSFED
jgi:hypothetical protein